MLRRNPVCCTEHFTGGVQLYRPGLNATKQRPLPPKARGARRKTALNRIKQVRLTGNLASAGLAKLLKNGQLRITNGNTTQRLGPVVRLDRARGDQNHSDCEKYKN